ncbi:MAG: sigma-54 dependent transcriptional regulator [Spirochaetes bacterium]|nr:sigma-54 dependent transcriptional regulator [Spirochaetota bacterium]MBU1079733.1 sigma-54 dependent transcriptional regulator [Spirochaetota bacterium]
MARVLVVDDDESYVASMTGYLRLKGHEAVGVAEPPPAAGLADEYDIVLLDIALGDRSGFDALDEYAAAGVPVAMVSGQADAANAVRAIKAGAVDVLEKPVDLGRLAIAIAMAEAKSALSRSDKAGKDAWLAEHLYVGESEAMKNLVAAAEKAARTSLGVLFHGPSGSGKEPLARWVHLRSPRCSGPFVAINCAAVPSDLAESEFFGHRRGSFTGADRDRAGCFVEAAGGTLFLDEVGELPLAMQAKLLRTIETSEYRPVGAEAPMKADVRIVSATNRDLKAEVAAGGFREDLLYRLAQVPLAVPPLSSRAADVPGLARFFALRAGSAGLGDEAIAFLARRDYPGNVRELKSVVERAVALSSGAPIDAALLESLDAMGWSAPPGGRGAAFPLDEPLPLKEAKRRMELAYIERQIELAGGSIGKAAERLSVLPNNLSRRLGELRAEGSA